MKKLISIVLVLLLLCSSASAAVDLSGMTFSDLVELRDQLNLAIWNCQEWQEVKVPAGVWEVGKDIPAGHWIITIVDNECGNVYYTDRLDDVGKAPGNGWHGYGITLYSRMNSDGSYSKPNEPRFIDLDMIEGMFFINHSPVIFTPYSGKPDLGFK